MPFFISTNFNEECIDCVVGITISTSPILKLTQAKKCYDVIK